MDIQNLKISIVHLLSDTHDVEVLQSIHTLLRKMPSSEDMDIAGYEADGEPISEEELIHSILEASADAKSGNTISFEKMKAELGL